ncbi:MAG: hypothetical protein RL660_2243, partial [Bacteroidota bacterium]
LEGAGVVHIEKALDSLKFTLLQRGDSINSATIPISYFKSGRSIVHFQRYTNFSLFYSNYRDENSPMLSSLLNCNCMQSMIFNQFYNLQLSSLNKNYFCSVVIVNSDLHYQQILYKFEGTSERLHNPAQHH